MLTMMDGGRSRAAEWAVCQNEECGKSFLRRADTYGKRHLRLYCSRECSAKAREDKVELECPVCTGKFLLPRSKVGNNKSGINLCSKECKDKAAKLDGGIKEIWPEHYGRGQIGIRKTSIAAKLAEGGCVDCGEKRGYFLTVHHIDGDRSHNEPSNLEVLCWNHHALRHLTNRDGVWVFGYMYLTPRDRLQELLEAG